jgi:hypothetical protein
MQNLTTRKGYVGIRHTENSITNYRYEWVEDVEGTKHGRKFSCTACINGNKKEYIVEIDLPKSSTVKLMGSLIKSALAVQCNGEG